LTSTKNPIVLIKTPFGDIKAEIFEEQAPITAKNFLRYVDEGLYDGTSFFRVVTMENQPNSPVKIEVIQGGIPSVKGKGYPSVYPPIEHETTQTTGILHTDRTLSMARSSPPNTATSSFSICIGDQHELDYMGKRNPDLHGFAAFGRVTEGMDVAKTIHNQPYEGQRLKPPIEIQSIRRI
jgi:peptidyl-prolyl cis-trans isomerase A (cyclophilin A)